MHMQIKRLLVLFGLVSLQVMAVGDETIYVVQPKSMSLRNRFEVAIEGAYNLNDRYTQEAGGIAQVFYHLRENLSLNVQGGWFFWQKQSALARDLVELRDVDGNPVMGADGREVHLVGKLASYYRMPWVVAAEIQWAPVYGKVLFHDVNLGLFQLYLGVGAGVSGLELRDPDNHDRPLELNNKLAMTTTVSGGLRFYFVNHVAIRLEIRDYIGAFAARPSELNNIGGGASTFDVLHKPMLQLGVGFVF